MYVNEDFIHNVLNASYYPSFEQWLLYCAKNDNKERVQGRFPRFDGDSVGLYFREAAKFYTFMKCCPPDSVTADAYGIYIHGAVYDFKPLCNLGIMGVVYLMSITDDKEYYGEDLAKGKTILNGMMRVDKRTTDILLKIVQGEYFVLVGEALLPATNEQKLKMLAAKRRVKVSPPPPLRNSKMLKEADVQLSALCSEELRSQNAKRLAFVKVLRSTVAAKVTAIGGSHATKWKWPHVQGALFASGHIVDKGNKAEFGRVMSDITGCTQKSIEQAFKRMTHRPTDENIIKEIQTVVDTAVSNAKEVRHATRSMFGDEDYGSLIGDLRSINESMAMAAYHIMSLEEFFCDGCTKELLADGFRRFAETYPSKLNKFDPKRIMKIMCQLICRLWNVGFIKSDIPCIEVARALANSFAPAIDVDKLNRQLMSGDLENYPKEYCIFFDLFEEVFEDIMGKKSMA